MKRRREKKLLTKNETIDIVMTIINFIIRSDIKQRNWLDGKEKHQTFIGKAVGQAQTNT